MKLVWCISLFIANVFAIDQHNQIILAPTTAAVDQNIETETPINTNVYVSGDLLCNDEGCYPLLFEPSEDWKVIKPEQRLPAGLDIRVNIDTGLKEAKLGDGNMATPKETTSTVKPQTETTSDIPSDNYEFSEQFTKLKDSSQKQDYTDVETQFEELMEFAHDYKYGYKIIIKEFDVLQRIALNNSFQSILEN